MSVITVDHLTKSYQTQKKREGFAGSLRDLVNPIYEDKIAVNDISFSIEPGELVGFIGPNGAGKTTTLKTLSGLLYPTSGTVRVLDQDPWERKDTFLRSISLVMGQKNQLWWDLPVSESFSLNRDIYNIPESVYKRNLKTLVEMLDLGSVLDVQVRKLSLGQRMKAELVAALLHDPKVLFLDEPTIGLDVTMQSQVREFIKTYNLTHDGAIMLTSHYMADVVELCKRVIIISEGSILYDGELSGVISKFSSHKIIEVILQDGTTKTYKVPRSKIAEKTTKLLADLPISDINIKEVAIEDIIRQVFAKNKKYLSIFSITLQEYFVYRLNMFMWRVRQVFVFLLPYFLWRAVLGGGGDIYGYDFGSIMTYLFGTTILRSLVMGSRTVDLGWMINSGMLTIPLMRPLNMFGFLLTRDAADKLFNLSFMFIEIPLILLVFRPPVFLQSDPYTLILTIVSIIFAILIYFFINIIFGSLGFWTRDVWAPRFLLMVILEFATGAMFPLDMLSNLWQSVLLWTPFPYLLFIPLRIYLGSSETIMYLIGQFIWVILLYLLAHYIWKRGLLRYEAEGR